jgi:AsmA protein
MNMNKILKYILLGTGALGVIAVAGVVYVVATFNPNNYKAQIIQAVKDSTQRNLRLDGDIKLSFYPNIGASLNKVSLSEFRSDKEFAATESARVALALMPLLRKQLVVDEVAVSGLKATLIKHKDGTSNIDDLLGQAKQKSEHPEQQQEHAVGSPVTFDIASVSVEKTDLSYHDESSGAQYAIKDLNFKTGRIAIGVPSKIDVSAVIQANQPKLDLSVQLKATLTFDLDKQNYQLQGLELQANGAALDINNLKVTASGDASANLTAQEYAAKKFVLNASGVKVKDKFEAKLDAPSLNLTQEKYSSDKLTLEASFGNIVTKLTLPGIEGNAQSFKVSALSLDMNLKQPEQAFKVKLSSPLSGNIKTQQFDLSNLNVAVTATGDKLPNKSVSSEMKGSIQIDATKKTMQANLAGSLLQSQVKAKVGVKDFANPAINFDVDVDQFDADLYLPKKSAETAQPQSKQPEPPLDLSALRTLNLDGSLRIGALKVMNVKSSQLRVDVKAHSGLVAFSPLSARLYQGSMNGSMTVNAQATPSVAINQNLGGINIAPLLKDAFNLDMLEGKGNVAVNLTMQGNTVSAMKKALNGKLSINLSDGALKGINLPQLVRSVQSLGMSSNMQPMGVNQNEKTEFSEFRASFKVNNGIAHNDDLAIKAPMLRITGNGDIDIGKDSLNYLAQATLSKTEGGGTATIPVQLNGPFTDLKYKVDFGAMLMDVAKQKFDTQKEELKNQATDKAKTRLQEKLKKGLEGLFK